MDKKTLINILQNAGYKNNTIKKYLRGGRNSTPTLRKALLLETMGIPLSAWADIKSFITQNDTKPKNCAQELRGVQECDDGNGSEKEEENYIGK